MLNRLVGTCPWVVAFLLIFAVYSFFLTPPGPNELSRYDLLLGIARDHTVVIDRYHLNTFDKSTFEGHYYSDKAIGATLLGLPWWWLADRVYGFGEYGEIRTDFPLWAATAGGVSVPSALLVLLVYWMGHRISGNRWRALLGAGAFGFATVAFPFSTMLYGHQPAAFFGFACFAAAFRWRHDGAAPSWLLFGAGLLGGLATITEYPTVIIAALVGAYVLSNRASREKWWLYAGGLLVGVVPLVIYNTVAFGKPWLLGYAFVEDPSFAVGHSGGILGVTWPRLSALAEITVGESGLVARSPLLLLTLLGGVLWWLNGRFRRELLCCSAIVVAFLTYNAGYYVPMGGHTAGPRFLIPCLPFLCLALGFLPLRACWAMAPLGLASTLLMVTVTSALPKALPGDDGVLLRYWWEHFRTGQVVPTWGNLRYGLEGVASLTPLLVVAVAGACLWVVWSRTRSRPTAIAGLALASLTYGAVALPTGAVPPLYAPPALDEPGSRPLSIIYDGRIELLAYRLDRDTAKQGERLALTLYWRAQQPVAQSYTVFIHLLDRDAQVLGGWDTIPGAGAFPTQMWTPGRVVAETYWVPVREDIALPALCRIEVGLYEGSTMRRLIASTQQRTRLGDSPLLARIAVPGPKPDLTGALPLDADLGGQVALVGYRPDTSDARRVRGRLYWKALRKPEKDYTVFVQALREGQVVVQWDAQPLGARYPTSLWSPGEVVGDWFELPLGEEERRGVTLIVGMYDLETMQRLPAGESTFLELPRSE